MDGAMLSVPLFCLYAMKKYIDRIIVGKDDVGYLVYYLSIINITFNRLSNLWLFRYRQSDKENSIGIIKISGTAFFTVSKVRISTLSKDILDIINLDGYYMKVYGMTNVTKHTNTESTYNYKEPTKVENTKIEHNISDNRYEDIVNLAQRVLSEVRTS